MPTPTIRNYSRPWTIGRGVVMVAGSFAPNGSSAVSAASNKGSGWSVAYTSTGLFTLTFEEKYKHLLAATASLQLTTGDDKLCQIGVVSLSARTVQIRVWDISAAAVADVAAAAGNRINFNFVFLRTNMVPVTG